MKNQEYSGPKPDRAALTKVNGYLWPASDTECRKVVFSTVSDMEPALELVRKHIGEPGSLMAMQAGGNCGVWANWLAGHFVEVFTVEPEPINHYCLTQNVNERVHTLPRPTGIGEKAGAAKIEIDPRNMGAGQLAPGDSGTIQIRTIDSLLEYRPYRLGYLCLDIEGMELLALKGARSILEADRPVIQIEDKGLSRRYGIEKGDAEKWLAAKFGYRVHSRPHRDVILYAEGRQ